MEINNQNIYRKIQQNPQIYKRKVQIKNNPIEYKNEIQSYKQNIVLNSNNNKKHLNSSVVERYKYKKQNQLVINNNSNLNKINNKYIYPRNNNIERNIIQSTKKDEKIKNNHLKKNSGKIIENIDNERKANNTSNNYSKKYLDNLNSYNKYINKNKSIEIDKNRNNKNEKEKEPSDNIIKKNNLEKQRISSKISSDNKNITENIRPISSNQNYNNYLKLSNGGYVFHYNKDLIKNENNNNNIQENDIKYPDNFTCIKCQENIKIKLNPDLLNISIECKNGHNIKNKLSEDFLKENDINKNILIKCFFCKKKYEKKNLYYCSCNNILCKECKKNKLHENHIQILYNKKFYICCLHNKEFISFCEKCNKNICNDCIKVHNNHKENIIYFKNIIKEKDIKNNKNELEKMKNNKNNFNKDFDEFIELFKIKKNEFIKKWENFIQIQNDIIDKVNNKKTLNYENICNLNEITMIKEKNNFYNDFLKKEKNFNKKGKYLLNLLSKEDIPEYKIKKEIKNFEIKSKKINEYKIINETNFNILNNEKKGTKNTICKNVSNIYIKNLIKKEEINKEKNQRQNQILIKGIKNIDNNTSNQDKIKLDLKQKEVVQKIPQKFEVIKKIENCEKKLENKDERCITSFCLLKNNKIVFTFKGGILKFYELEKINDEIKLKELIRLEEDEYCFNYAIELYDDNIAACSEDGTIKIIELNLDKKEKYKIIQIIKEMNDDPIYSIKELENHNLVLGCWKNILIYQKNKEYELINKIMLKEYTFSILEIAPNEIITSHTESKTLTGHNFNNYKFYKIKNIESNENRNIICKYNNNKDIIFVAFDEGINIVSIKNKILIQKIILNEIISSLCPIEMEINIENKNKKIFGLLLGTKRKIFGEKVNYAYSMLQIGFNMNNKDQGNIYDDINKKNEIKIISRKDRIHYYDIVNMENSLLNKNKETLNIIENKQEQWIFTTGNEDKLFKIWKFK